MNRLLGTSGRPTHAPAMSPSHPGRGAGTTASEASFTRPTGAHDGTFDDASRLAAVLVPGERRRAAGARVMHGRGEASQRRQPTPGQAIRLFCMDCVGASSTRGAFDCLSRICLLYGANPFRGRPMPKTLRVPEEDYNPATLEEERESMRICAARPRQRPSRKLIRAYCRSCQPGDRTDCLGVDCALYPYRPWPGPGHVPKRERTAKQRAAAVNGLRAASQNAGNALTEGQFTAKGGR